MKIVKAVVLLSFTIFILLGCDELIKKNVDVPITFTVTQNATVPAKSDPNKTSEFVSGGEYDILSHPDVAEVIGTPDKIKKIKITKILYEFKNFTGNVDATVSGYFSLPRNTNSSSLFSNLDDDIAAIFTINPVNVAEAMLLREQFTLNGNFDEVNDYLSQNAIFQHAFVGSSTHNPAIFNIVLTVSATVTVEASIDFKGNYN